MRRDPHFFVFRGGGARTLNLFNAFCTLYSAEIPTQKRACGELLPYKSKHSCIYEGKIQFFRTWGELNERVSSFTEAKIINFSPAALYSTFLGGNARHRVVFWLWSPASNFSHVIEICKKNSPEWKKSLSKNRGWKKKFWTLCWPLERTGQASKIGMALHEQSLKKNFTVIRLFTIQWK